MNSGGVDAEQVLRTEASILGSDDLHRTVIREIGIGKMYPKLLEKPGPVGQWMQDVRQFITESAGLTDKTTGPEPADPMARAVEAFGHNLTITVDKKSSVIGLDFTNPNKTVSADALRILETQYLVLRNKLYGDVQAPMVQIQRNVVGSQGVQAAARHQQFLGTPGDFAEAARRPGNGADQVRSVDRRTVREADATKPAAWPGGRDEEGYAKRIRRLARHGTGLSPTRGGRTKPLSGLPGSG
jgi:hypothetical protein